MKRLALVFIGILLLGMMVPAVAETIYIGEGTGTQRFPLGNYFGYERSAAIYAAGELGNMDMEITSLGWYATLGFSEFPFPVKIYLKEVNSLVLSAGPWANHVDGATEVYDGDISLILPNVWTTFNLSGPFQHEADKHLLVLVETNAGYYGYAEEGGLGFRYSITGDIDLHAHWGSDWNPPTGNGTGSNQRPNIAIGYQEGQTPVYYTYSLFLNASDGGSYAFTGPMDGSTGIPMTTGPQEEDVNPFIGTYTIAEEAPEGFFWMNETLEIDADDFEEDPDYPNSFTASGVFELQQIYTWPLKAVDRVTLAPIADATIWYEWEGNAVAVGTTDAEGRFVFTSQPGNNLYPGAGVYFMTKPGYFNWDPEALQMDIRFLTQDLDESIFEAETSVPVELSSFTATLSAQSYVQINWITQSENSLMGWRLYRGETSSQQDALTITPILIPATNTSQQQIYSLSDTEVELGSIYYYWLECVEAASSSFYGPVSVTVESEMPGIYPTVTQLKNAWPNPFKAQTGTTIGVDIKEGETGSLTIYNIQGQALKTQQLANGSHEVVWNGLDSNGKACGSGIYFYKLSTSSLNQSKKMVIIK